MTRCENSEFKDERHSWETRAVNSLFCTYNGWIVRQCVGCGVIKLTAGPVEGEVVFLKKGELAPPPKHWEVILPKPGPGVLIGWQKV